MPLYFLDSSTTYTKEVFLNNRTDNKDSSCASVCQVLPNVHIFSFNLHTQCDCSPSLTAYLNLELSGLEETPFLTPWQTDKRQHSPRTWGTSSLLPKRSHSLCLDQKGQMALPLKYACGAYQHFKVHASLHAPLVPTHKDWKSSHPQLTGSLCPRYSLLYNAEDSNQTTTPRVTSLCSPGEIALAGILE